MNEKERFIAKSIMFIAPLIGRASMLLFVIFLFLGSLRLFFVLPSMGLGVFGRRSPEGIRLALSSLANHLFYGVGIAVWIALV